MRSQLFIVAISLVPCIMWAQQPDTLIKKLDSLSNKANDVGPQNNNINPSAYNDNTQLNVKSYFILLGSDFKQEVTLPFHTSSKNWIKVAKYGIVTVAASFADEPIQRFAVQLRNDNKTVVNVSKYITNFGGLYEAYTLGALGAYGFIFKKEKIKTTTLLATQAYLVSGALESLLKLLSGRQRPSYIDPNALEAEPTFHGPFYKATKDVNGKRINSSFPSGHTTVAFAAATVFSMEYKDKPFIPVISYTAATLIGLSRITENKHWATDVLVGAAIGYLTGRQVVNNYHRYAKLKAPLQKKNTVSFNLQYNNGHLMPGLIYTFR